MAGIGLVGVSADLIARAALLPGIAALQVSIVGVRFFGISKGIFRYLERLVTHSVNFRLLENLRWWFYSKLEPLTPARLSKYQNGDLLSRLISDIDTLDTFYIRCISPVVTALIISIGITWYISRFTISAAIYYGLLVVLGGIILPIFFHKIGQQPNQHLVNFRSNLSGGFTELLRGKDDILAFGQEKKVLSQLKEKIHKVRQADSRSGWLQAFSNSLMVLIGQFAMLGVLVFVSISVRAKEVNPSMLAVLVVIALAGFEVVFPLPQTAQMVQSSLSAAKRMFNISDKLPAVVDPLIPKQLKELSPLEISDLSFTYQPNIKPALSQINLVLVPGKKVALVGASGSGKSTLFSLIMRFWDYQHGAISLGGIDLRDVESEDIRRNISAVMQNEYIFTATLRQNLKLGNPSASEHEIDQALDAVGLRDWVMSLPDGLETWLGNHGVALSAGQAHRISIARAMLKKSAYLLIDEPAANLDPKSAADLMRIIQSHFKDRGLLIITHWFAGLEDMDEIVVFDGGSVSERGSHAELMRLDGWYARTVKIQQGIMN
jgi:ATP-binding cassette subfamily C protein CydC